MQETTRQTIQLYRDQEPQKYNQICLVRGLKWMESLLLVSTSGLNVSGFLATHKTLPMTLTQQQLVQNITTSLLPVTQMNSALLKFGQHTNGKQENVMVGQQQQQQQQDQLIFSRGWRVAFPLGQDQISEKNALTFFCCYPRLPKRNVQLLSKFL